MAALAPPASPAPRVQELARLLTKSMEGHVPQAPNKVRVPLPHEWLPAEAAACANERTRSQFLEDIALLPTLLGVASSLASRATPRFVELGALDGWRMSNTIVLERCFNWTGTLIEANPTSFAQLRRSARNADKVHSAICAGEGGPNSTVRMFAEGKSTTGQVDSVTASQIRKYYGGTTNGTTTVQVPCRSLSSILSQVGHRRAVFLSLDVEGAEALVLANADPAAFDVILVEVQDHSSSNRQRIDELITHGGRMRRATNLWVPFSAVYVSQRVREVAMPHRFVRTRRGVHSATYKRTSQWQNPP
jgi:FkbM family methyltransferase